VTNRLTVYDVTGIRYGIGAVVALPYIIWSRAWRGLTAGRILVLTLTSGLPYALLSYIGLTYAPAAHGGVFLNGCLPIVTALFAWIWIGQKSRFSQVVGLGIILIGVTLVGYEGFTSSGGGTAWIGDFLFLAAISLFAVFMVANRVWTITPGQILFAVTIKPSIPVFFHFRNLPDAFFRHAVGCQVGRNLVPIGNFEDPLHVLIDPGYPGPPSFMADVTDFQTVGVVDGPAGIGDVIRSIDHPLLLQLVSMAFFGQLVVGTAANYFAL
jgi:uncharacterized membrane protein